MKAEIKIPKGWRRVKNPQEGDRTLSRGRDQWVPVALFKSTVMGLPGPDYSNAFGVVIRKIGRGKK